MNFVTHFFGGWTMTLPAELERRDRTLIVTASIAPDIDGLVILADFVGGHSTDALDLWSRYHHVLCHNIGFACLMTALCAILARRRFMTAGLAWVAVHLHFLADIAGSRGPEGFQWPIPYLLPFSDSWQLTVDWQWTLNSWQNILITICLLAITIYYAWFRGKSPVGLFSLKADRSVVETLRKRFGNP